MRRNPSFDVMSLSWVAKILCGYLGVKGFYFFTISPYEKGLFSVNLLYLQPDNGSA